MNWTNYHHHSQFDDGNGTIEQHVISAIKQGVKSMGFSGHCPFPFKNKWAMKYQDIDNYLNEIEIAKRKYQDQIEIYKSLEIDYIPGIISPVDTWIKNLKLDYTIGSIHYAGKFEDGSPVEVDNTHSNFLHGLKQVYQDDIKSFVTEYFALTRKMVNDTKPDIIGHLDKIKMQNNNLWDEESAWYRNEILKTLEEIRSANSIVEVNTRGLYKKKAAETYPGKWILNEILKMNIPVHINSDAHHPREVTCRFNETLDLLHEIGFCKVKILHKKQWVFTDINKNGLNW